LSENRLFDKLRTTWAEENLKENEQESERLLFFFEWEEGSYILKKKTHHARKCTHLADHLEIWHGGGPYSVTSHKFSSHTFV
jgi:hypothetical protein